MKIDTKTFIIALLALLFIGSVAFDLPDNLKRWSIERSVNYTGWDYPIDTTIVKRDTSFERWGTLATYRGKADRIRVVGTDTTTAWPILINTMGTKTVIFTNNDPSGSTGDTLAICFMGEDSTFFTCPPGKVQAPFYECNHDSVYIWVLGAVAGDSTINVGIAFTQFRRDVAK